MTWIETIIKGKVQLVINLLFSNCNMTLIWYKAGDYYLLNLYIYLIFHIVIQNGQVPTKLNIMYLLQKRVPYMVHCRTQVQ